MPVWIMSKVTPWLLLAVSVLIGAAYVKGSWDGAAGCEASHIVAKEKATEKVREVHAEIKRKAPDDTDKRTAIEWLRQRTRQ